MRIPLVRAAAVDWRGRDGCRLKIAARCVPKRRVKFAVNPSGVAGGRRHRIQSAFLTYLIRRALVPVGADSVQIDVKLVDNRARHVQFECHVRDGRAGGNPCRDVECDQSAPQCIGLFQGLSCKEVLTRAIGNRSVSPFVKRCVFASRQGRRFDLRGFDCDRDRGRGRRKLAVVGRVGKGIGSGEARVGRIGERAIGIQRQRSTAGIGCHASGQVVIVRIVVVGQHAAGHVDRQSRVFVR